MAHSHLTVLLHVQKNKTWGGGRERKIFIYYYCRQQKHAAVQTNSWALAAAVWLQETGTSTGRDLQIFHVSETFPPLLPAQGKGTGCAGASPWI